MSHLDESTLVLLHYGEPVDDTDRRHLESCSSCQAELESLTRDLSHIGAAELEVPERGDDYGAAVWARVSESLELAPAAKATRGRAWLPLAAAAVLLLAFFAGRLSTRWYDTAPPGAVRERVLLVALDEHLDRSRMLLLEVQNASGGELDRELAEELLAESRLYRQSGEGVLDVVTTDALDQIERVLLDVAHETSPPAAIRERLDRQDVLFKIRLLQASLREREEGTEPQVF